MDRFTLAFPIFDTACSILRESLDRFKQLANNGNPRAALQLCRSYKTPFSCTMTPEELKQYATQAIQGGYVEGNRHLLKEIQPSDKNRYHFHLMQGAIGGDTWSILHLARRYKQEGNLDRSAQWYRILTSYTISDTYVFEIYRFFHKRLSRTSR